MQGDAGMEPKWEQGGMGVPPGMQMSGMNGQHDMAPQPNGVQQQLLLTVQVLPNYTMPLASLFEWPSNLS